MYQIVKVTGPEAETFLQGQLTQDLGVVQPSNAPLAALLSPKGRVISTLRLLAFADGYLLLVPNGMADAVTSRLLMYKLRAKVDIAADGDMSVAATTSADDLARLTASGLMPEQKRNAAARSETAIAWCPTSNPLAVEVAGPMEVLADLVQQPMSAAEWSAMHIAAGIVHIGGETSEEYTPHMLSLDQAGALSFDKGCYTGQEVVARTEHLGKAKRRLHRFSVTGGTTAPGDRLHAGERAVGTVVNVTADQLLAVSPVDQAADELTVNDAAVEPREICWE